MEILTWILCAFVLSGFMAYFRASLTTYTLSFMILMALGTAFNIVSFLGWFTFGVLAIPLNVTSIRHTYMTVPFLQWFKGIMPTMSKTEQEAIDAGTTWFESDLFRGAPSWTKLHNYPQPRLSAEELSFIDGPVNEVCGMINDFETSHERADLSPEVWAFLKEHKFFAMIIKKEYGGLEFCAYAQSRILQKLAGTSSVLAITVGVPNSLGPGELLQHYGTQAQKDHYLPRLVQGDEIPCFALTSPEAGSDAGSIPDEGIVCYGDFEGENILGMRLTWDKRYITLAPIATVLGLAFKLKDPEHLLGDTVELGITCALIPTSHEGVITGRRHFPLNIPFQNGPTQGKDVFVPIDWIIGGKEMAGQGWRMLVECLSVGRAITLPSNSTGVIKSVALATGAYSRIRRQFKLPIGKMEGVEEALAQIGGNAYLMDAVTSLSTGAIDLGEKPSVISAICKYHLTEKMRDCIIHAMDIHGGKGICMGQKNYLARNYQGAPIAVTVEGANILTRSMIIYGQGAIRCHPYVLAEIEAAKNPNEEEAIPAFDHALFGHIGFTLSNVFRSFWFGLTGARLLQSPFHDCTSRYYQLMTRFSANLAMLSDIAMFSLGSDLKRKERISARLGDVLSYLYLASATLKRFNDEGRQKADQPLMKWAVEDCLYKTQMAIIELLNNFPNKTVALTMRCLIFPLGAWIKKPSDKLEHKISKILQTVNESRDRLGEGQYLTPNKNNVWGDLETGLVDILACEPIFDKVCHKLGEKFPFHHLNELADKALAAKVITQSEAEILRKAELSRKSIIDVNDFDPIELVSSKYAHQEADAPKTKAAKARKTRAKKVVSENEDKEEVPS